MNFKTLTAATALLGTMAFAVPAYAANDVGAWNTDKKAGINASEYRNGLKATGVFDKWDVNNDMKLSKKEFTDHFGDKATAFNGRFGADYFTRWDANSDGLVDENEFYNGTYLAYDADKNKIIDEPEFGDLGDDIGDGGFWDV